MWLLSACCNKRRGDRPAESRDGGTSPHRRAPKTGFVRRKRGRASSNTRARGPPRLRPEIRPIRSHDCAWNTCQSQCSSEFIRVFETSSLRRVMLPLVTTHPFAIDEFRRIFQSLGETLLPRRRASPRGLYQLLRLCLQLHSIFAVRSSPTPKL